MAVVGGSVPGVSMAWLAEVVVAATEERLRAAEMAFPGDVLMPMLLAVELPATYLFDRAPLASQILLACRLSEGQITFALG